MDGGHVDAVGGGSLAVTRHVCEPREVRVLVHESCGLTGLQEPHFLQPLAQLQLTLEHTQDVLMNYM